MNKQGTSLVLWVGYVWAKTLAGLAVHPYQSVKRMVFGDQVLLPVTLSPVFGLLVLFIVGRVASFVMNVDEMWREIIALILGSTLIGILMWQLLLVALVYRFWRAK